MEVARDIGAAIVKRTGKKVSLKDPDLTVYLETTLQIGLLRNQKDSGAWWHAGGCQRESRLPDLRRDRFAGAAAYRMMNADAEPFSSTSQADRS